MATLTDAALAGRRRRWLSAPLLFVLAAGCSQPQVPRDHRELVLRLATGTSTQDKGIIERAAAEIEHLATAGELTDDEGAAFRSIIKSAEAGDWERARVAAYALRDGQEPTEEDRQRIEKRPLPEMKKPGSTRKAH